MEQSDELSSNLQPDHGKDAEKPRFAGLYREDVVQSVAQPGVLGLVAKVAGDSDSDSSDSEDEENKGDDDALSQGSARVCWANSEESTHKIEDIRVVDRSFLHGDIVARVSAPMGQTGMVINVDLRVDLQLPNGEVISDVDSKTIRRVRIFTVGEYVVSEQWLGRIDEIYDNVTVMFEDGAKCKISCADPERLVPISVSPMDDSECPYYPGQRVRGNFTGLFKAARWLKGSWKPSRIEGTVIDVDVDSLVIYWMAAASSGHNSQAPGIPAERQNPKNVKRLKNFSYTSWQLGDRALLPQRLATRKGPVMPSVPLEQDAHSDNEAETTESIEQAQDPGCLEVGKPTATSGKEPGVDSWVAYRRKLKRRFTKHKKKTIKKDDFYEHALLIVGTKTKVDVVWQDGTREKGVDTCSLFPVDHLGDHDFWPEQHVMERGSDLDGFESEMNRRAGIVKTVDSKQRTARIRWLAPTSHPQKWPCFESEEVVSVYELIEHPDYDYCLGDVVIRLSPTVDLPKEPGDISLTAEVNDSTGADCEQEQGLASCSTGVGAPETESSTNASDLSWVGIITACQDGQIEVAWADGEVSKVGSQAIFVVGRDEDDGSSQASAVEMDEEMDDAGSWTTIDSTEMNDVDEEQELGQSEGCDESAVHDGGSEHARTSGEAGRQLLNSSRDLEDSSVRQSKSENGLGSTLSLPFGALIRALKFAASLLWALRGPKRQPESGQDRCISDAQCEAADKVTRAEENSSGICENFENVTQLVPEKSHGLAEDSIADEVKAQGSDILAPIASAETESKDDLSGGNDETVPEHLLGTVPRVGIYGLFKQFDSVKDTADHHFKNEESQPTNQRRWSKKLQQEWAMLEKCLPDTIFVRVYEDRMDLMRSVIVGAMGTPYHDGLFFFDLYLPAEYPSSPPHVHYHSGGLRLNPNLYETGKVCLSLLNTWTGKGNEIWHSSSSSILQVLVSIQGLVLNSNPYFNEAGYDKQMGTAEGEKNSLAYVENTFLLSCKSMVYLIRRPPMHFEEFVREHFKHRGPRILQACLAYMQGCPVGSLMDEGVGSPSPLGTAKESEQSTIGFRLMLAKIIPRLIAAFKEVGATCEPYEEQFNSTKQIL